MGAKRMKGAKDEVTYIYLMKHTEKGAVQSVAQKRVAINAVTKLVRKEGGNVTCTRPGEHSLIL